MSTKRSYILTFLKKLETFRNTELKWFKPYGFSALRKSTSHIPVNIPHPTSHIPNVHISNIQYPDHPSSQGSHIPHPKTLISQTSYISSISHPGYPTSPHFTSQTFHIPNTPHVEHRKTQTCNILNIANPKHPTSQLSHIANRKISVLLLLD